MTVKITIEGMRYAPKWVTLQDVMRDATNNDGLLFTRINRKDKGCDYRGHGVYDIDYIDRYGDVSRMELTIK